MRKFLLLLSEILLIAGALAKIFLSVDLVATAAVGFGLVGVLAFSKTGQNEAKTSQAILRWNLGVNSRRRVLEPAIYVVACVSSFLALAGFLGYGVPSVVSYVASDVGSAIVVAIGASFCVLAALVTRLAKDKFKVMLPAATILLATGIALGWQGIPAIWSAMAWVCGVCMYLIVPLPPNNSLQADPP